MKLNRRTFFKVAGTAGAVALAPARKAGAATNAEVIDAGRRGTRAGRAGPKGGLPMMLIPTLALLGLLLVGVSSLAAALGRA